jgi:rhodanese-related sulfurtransferase
VVDVRETEEFRINHFEVAINIPLGIIPLRLAIQQENVPLPQNQ